MKMAEYVGDCTDTFDKKTGGSRLKCFIDVSDFAVKDENNIELTEEEFNLFVKEVPESVKNKIEADNEHPLKYMFYDGNIYVLYDSLNDIHYFFY